MGPLISVLIPIYNVESYLPKCLDSILAQTYSNLEIILVDDGSTDRSGAICDEYARKDNRITLIHQNNKGVSAARNMGLELYSGEHLMFVDADDYIRSDAVEVLYNRMVEDGSDLVVGQITEVFHECSRVNPLYVWMYDTVLSAETALAHIGSSQVLYGYPCGKLYRSSIFEGLKFPPLICGEDAWIFPEIVVRCNRVSISSEILYYYVQRSSSTVHTESEQHIWDCVRSRIHNADFLLRYGLKENARTFFNAAVYGSIKLKNSQRARQLLNASFSFKERVLLSYKDFGTLSRWLILYMPFLYAPAQTTYQLIKKIRMIGKRKDAVEEMTLFVDTDSAS